MSPLVDYVGRIFRPPSEAKSLLLQVTVGCSHNRCTYCDMYRDKTFRSKPWALIEADIDEAAALSERSRRGPVYRRVFLCDGDALILSTNKLVQVLTRIRERMPYIERVGVYGDTRSVLKKSVEELRELRALGLGIVYHGMETGDAEVMERIDKGATPDDCRVTAERLRAADIDHSVMVLLGVGGRALSQRHAKATGQLLSEMDPAYVGALTTTVVPGTPLYDQQAAGTFALPSKMAMLKELHTIIEHSDFSACRFSANHASNYLPLRAQLPEDKPALLRMLAEVIDSGDEGVLKPEWMRGL